MAISLQQLMELAEKLQQMKESEATSRAAVSRSYYAALHATKATFDERQRVEGESSHAEIISRARVYGSGTLPGRTEAREIAIWMPRLRRLRNVADYELANALTEDEAAGHIARAKAVLAHCESIREKRQQSTSSC